MESIISNKIIIPIEQFTDESSTNFGEVLLVNGIACEYIDILEDTQSNAYCVFEHNEKAVTAHGIYVHEQYHDSVKQSHQKMKDDINLVIMPHGYQCHEVEYQIPEFDGDPIELTAYILDFDEFNSEPDEVKKVIDKKLLAINYEVMFSG